MKYYYNGPKVGVTFTTKTYDFKFDNNKIISIPYEFCKSILEKMYNNRSHIIDVDINKRLHISDYTISVKRGYGHVYFECKDIFNNIYIIQCNSADLIYF